MAFQTSFALIILSFFFASYSTAASSQPMANHKPRVTLIGDSHTALAFGDAFYKKLSQDFSVHLIASSSSRPKHWVDSLFVTPSKNGASEYAFDNPNKFHCVHKRQTLCQPGDKKDEPNEPCCLSTVPLSEILQNDNPDFVIIALGANLHRETAEIAVREIQSLIEQLGPRPCFWIAPPYSSAERVQTQKPVVEYLLESQEVTSKCTVYNSSIVTYGITAADGVHYSAEQPVVEDWAEDAAQNFIQFAKIRRSPASNTHLRTRIGF